jgi:hypothetical protein
MDSHRVGSAVLPHISVIAKAATGANPLNHTCFEIPRTVKSAAPILFFSRSARFDRSVAPLTAGTEHFERVSAHSWRRRRSVSTGC